MYHIEKNNMTTLYRLWGKTNERDKDKGDDWKWHSHPAICHMVDVAYVAETWLQLNPRLMDRFCQLAPGIDREDLLRIIVTIIALHDLGKLHRCFQAKSDEGWTKGYGADGVQRINGAGFDHGRATGVMMRSLVRKQYKHWKRWYKAFDMVAGHHGTLYGNSKLQPMPSNCPAWPDEQPFVLEAIEALCRLFKMPTELPNAPKDNGFYMLLAGFCAVCDWLGSDSTTYLYAEQKGLRMESFDDIQFYLSDLREQGVAKKQFVEQGILADFKREPLAYQDLFEILKKYPLRPLQTVSTEILFGRKAGSEIVIVEAPMGMGKTEIALYLAMQAIGSGNADGLYFALPTQASSNALFDRITAFAETARAPEGQLSVVLAHGGSRFFEKYQELKDRTWRQKEAWLKTVQELGGYRDTISPPSEIVATQWLERSKQSLLAGVGVGTIDQAMLGAITVKHAFVRLFALANKVVVFDEIHAYDAYMNQVILHLLQWLHTLGAKVILLSATLPRKLKKDLLSAYKCTLPDTDTSPENDPYPQILYGHTGIMEEPFVVPAQDRENDRKVPVRIKKIETVADERTSTGAQKAVELARDGGCIAWIRNTVKEAQAAWQAVKDELREQGIQDVEVRLIHARYTRTDRNLIEEELVDVLGNKPGAKRPTKMIVVATQVIEQSVDIDFDAMISDLAPVDLLLQRLGRMWRHVRPLSVRYNHTEAALFVLTPNAEEIYEMQFGSSTYVYDAEILARTATLTVDNDVWHMPDACRTLVAAVYDHEDVEWTAERQNVDPATLDKVRTERHTTQSSETGQAKRILMPNIDASRIEMEDALKDDDREERVALTTRLGGASGTVILLEERNGQICFAGSGSKRGPISISTLPDPKDFRAMIEFDEAVTLSAVSFPWYRALERPEYDHPELVALDAWWRDRRPYDNKIFLLLDSNGKAEHPQFTAYYRHDKNRNPVEGLIIDASKERTENTPVDYTVI